MDMNTGSPQYFYVSALQAFWPALQVLSGHLSAAKSTFSHLHDIWSRFQALPDIFDVNQNALLPWARDSPLRPELIESAYYLYSATGDSKYVQFGKDVLWALQNRSRVACGFASIADVETGRLDDRMDSFFLSESLKYLFLLFDEALPEPLRASVFCNPSSSSKSYPNFQDSPLASEEISGERNNILLQTLGNDKFQTKISRSKSCVSKVNSLFSTEGHVFIIDRSLRFGSTAENLSPSGADAKGTADSNAEKIRQRRNKKDHVCYAAVPTII